MRRIAIAAVLVFTALFSLTGSASAQFPGDYGGFPYWGYGFYSPYGAHYSTSLRTPPYFATHPPVYYGARHARPYGISPFASLPLVGAPASYRSRLDTDAVAPPAATGCPSLPPCVSQNPCVSYSRTVKPVAVRKGPVRENPYFTDDDDAEKLARK